MDDRFETGPARLTRAAPEAGASVIGHGRWNSTETRVRNAPTSVLLLAVPAITAKAAEHDWLGEPTGPHLRINGIDGYRRNFEHGSVYWTRRTGAHELHGEIAEAWRRNGGERSRLGFPTTDTRATDDGRGRYSHFEGGSVYWTPEHGAAMVCGMVRDAWAVLGWERSRLGFPVQDVVDEGGVRRGLFEHGSITWSPATGPLVAYDGGR